MKVKKLLTALLAASCLTSAFTMSVTPVNALSPKTIISVVDVPEFSDEPYVEINGNKPYFTDSDITTDTFEIYSELDSLGRCGIAYANVCTDIMPTEPRGEIGSIKPSGWHSVEYDCVDGKYLYNRCHLIGYQLAGENANEKNLITGTRYLNIDGMLPFENAVDDYVDETDNHVLYRVTPDFEDNNLVADGVQIEAYSVEDNGEGICYNVYCYNAQPGIEIDYKTGSSSLASSTVSATGVKGDANGDGYLRASDAAFIAKKLAEAAISGNSVTIAKYPNADYNNDGKITAADSAAIAKYLASKNVPVVTTTKKTTTPTTKTTVKTTKKTTTTTVKSVPSVVYITKTGKRYHYNSKCNGGTYYECSYADAIKKGLTPCNKCVK